MNTLFSFLDTAANWVWQTSLWASVLALLVFLTAKVFGARLSPRMKYALSFLVLLRLLLPFAPTSSLSLANLLRVPARHQLSPALKDSPDDPTAPSPSHAHFSAPSLFALVWISGACALACVTLSRWRQWSRLARDAEPLHDPRVLALLDNARATMNVRRPVTALATPDHIGPAVFGIHRVYLFLPQSLPARLNDDELSHVLLHEMAHVRRHDTALNGLLMALQLVHWFNPFVWIAFRRLRADRELVCDEMVLTGAHPDQRLRYGRLLLKLMDEFPTDAHFLPTAAITGSKQEIKQRIVMIKTHGTNRTAACAAALIVAVALGCATFTRAEAPTPALAGPALLCDAAPADLGALTAGDIIKHVYTVTNGGDQPLEITAVRPSCGCTVLKDFTPKIAPGQTGKITVEFNSANKHGSVTRTIKIFSNARGQSPATVAFTATIGPVAVAKTP